MTVNEKKSAFCSHVIKIKMSVKRKLNTKTLKDKYDILSHIGKDMADKEAADKFGVPKNTISTWVKKKIFFQGLEESASSTKRLRGCHYEKVHKALFE